MPTGAEEAAAVGSAGATALTLNQIIDFIGKSMLGIFIIVSAFYIINTPNVITAITDKIVGYPSCTGKLGSVPFCFAPSAGDYTNTLLPTYTGLAKGFAGDVGALLSTVISFGFIASIFMMFKLTILGSAAFKAGMLLLGWYKYLTSLMGVF